jgi:hypothetical protein
VCVVIRRRKKRKYDVLGEPGEVGLPGIKGPPGDSGLCMYTEKYEDFCLE